jgi:F-box/TPR repeat protein Pof3
MAFTELNVQYSMETNMSQLLRGAHNKLNRQLSPPTAVDPLSRLPLEIAEMIIGYLKFYEIV